MTPSQTVEARSLCVGDVIVTSEGDRMRVMERALVPDGVQLRLSLNRPERLSERRSPFVVPRTTRFRREEP